MVDTVLQSAAKNGSQPINYYEMLRRDKYDHIAYDDTFKLLVWNCYAW
ncbi:Uncharacterised protein [uncultured Ruminococcus sp.]|nr:Uncharacterised protein [uncultured Ruminococcus sp.]